MFIKSFTLSFPLLLWIATPCFAETVEVRTNEPSSQYLGMKIDLVGRAFVDSFSVAPGKSLFISKSLTDVRIKKDNVDGLNKFHALVAYSLHSGNAKPSEPRFLYVKCPVTRETYIDRSVFKDEMIDGVMYSAMRVDQEVLSKKFLSLGSYSFLSSPDDVVPLLSSNFPMVGKFGKLTPIELIPIEAMCLKIEVAHAEYQWNESFRKITLKKFCILE